MAHKLDLNDFRAQRSVLDPTDFALGEDEPDAPPTDIISEKAWSEIMSLPDDVVIRTTSHQGSRIQILHDLHTSWVRSMPEKGILAESMLDVADDLDAALFNLMHGYYKQSISACRNALELTTLACACQLYGPVQKWDKWQQGKSNLNFQQSCREFAAHEALIELESAGQRGYGLGVNLFPADDLPSSRPRAWTTNLYSRLCEFAHPRGTNGQLWESNGPIYSAKGMEAAYCHYLETYAMLILLIKLAKKEFHISDEVRLLFDQKNIEQYVPKEFIALCTFYGNTLLYSG